MNLGRAVRSGLIAKALSTEAIASPYQTIAQSAQQRDAASAENASSVESAPPHGDVPPTLRRSLKRRLLSRMLRVLRAARIPHFDKIEQRAREAVDAVSIGLRRLRPTKQALKRLEGKIEGLEQRAIQARLGSVDLAQWIAETDRRVDSLLCRNVFSIAPDILVTRNRYGYLCVPTEDRKLVGLLADGALPEPGTRKLLEALLKPGSTFLDVGAHIGMFALLGARLVGDSGRVIALEPTPRLADLLRQTAVMNNVEGVIEIHEMAASDTNAQTTLNIAFPYGHNSLFALPGAHASVTVRCVTIDELLGRTARVDVIKIDAEGAELAVLRGMKATLAANQSAVAILEFGPSHLKRIGVTATSWVEEVKSLGFDVWEIDDRTMSLHPLPNTGLEDLYSTNVLLARGMPESLRSLMRDPMP
jgi:FkbM family methyltransferase